MSAARNAATQHPQRQINPANNNPDKREQPRRSTQPAKPGSSSGLDKLIQVSAVNLSKNWLCENYRGEIVDPREAAGHDDQEDPRLCSGDCLHKAVAHLFDGDVVVCKTKLRLTPRTKQERNMSGLGA